jgi:hypothetical protein
MSFDGAPQKKSGSKVLLILGVVAGVAALACCGILGYGIYQIKPVETKVASEVKERTATMVDLQIDEEKFEPTFHVSTSIPLYMDFSLAKWDSKADDGGLLLAKILIKKGAEGQGEEALERAMKDSLSQGGNQEGQPQMPTLIGNSTPETIKFLGEDRDFVYTEGKREGSDEEYKELKGSGRVDKKIVIVRIQTKAENFDKQAILDMLADAQ